MKSNFQEHNHIIEKQCRVSISLWISPLCSILESILHATNFFLKDTFLFVKSPGSHEVAVKVFGFEHAFQHLCQSFLLVHLDKIFLSSTFFPAEVH